MDIGETVSVPYPFIREEYHAIEEDGSCLVPCWRPGVRQNQRAVYYGNDYDFEADGEGRQLLTLISRHKPGKYPERAFYTQTWVDPDGKPFGKRKLRMTTWRRFVGLTHGYAYHYAIKENTAHD